MRYAKKSMPVVCLVAALHTGCGGSEEVDACYQFIDTACSRAEACGLGDTASCVKATEAAFPGDRTCDDVVKIRDAAELDVCMQEIQQIACSDFVSKLTFGDLPSECRNQILFDQ